MLEQDDALTTMILPVTYAVIDVLRPIPHVPSWMLPMIASVVGATLGVTWGTVKGQTGEGLILYGVVGFGFGSGATGVNQIKRQTEKRRDEQEQEHGTNK